ncbi:pectin lyase fold/virulence factor, AmbAllergen [Artemisia annua]|uniref:Pectate lyase n=1 Tax=Artemisia annua TaxID=35608 RepID=A0A2U1LPF8_ARTAN|nr:pectin lyase fold/virulence factor, AmbAllergen [Artemisia annua]
MTTEMCILRKFPYGLRLLGDYLIWVSFFSMGVKKSLCFFVLFCILYSVFSCSVFMCSAFYRKVNDSITSRRRLLETDPIFAQSKDQAPCQTGNPVDDCWRCDPNWANDRQRLADCAIGFGQDAMGGKGGRIYVVSDSSDGDPENPQPGTLRHAVIQAEPLWIIFDKDMHINLKNQLIVSSSKTIDGRGAIVHVTGKGCILIENVGNIIIHGLYIHDCEPSGEAKLRVSPTNIVGKGKSDGDGLTIRGVRNLWIDHCSFARCTDGLVDITEGSTAVTVSNSYFTEHDKVMLLGHSDDFLADAGMQVTVAFNHFGKGLVERMPRCRHGYFHVVNNDYTEWQLYAIGGSAAPTINSQGNRFVANSHKEVTKRMEANDDEWKGWNWRTEGDLMVNGAFFVPSGAEISVQYDKASSVPPMSAYQINQLTMHAGVLLGVPSVPPGTTPPDGGPPVITPPVDGQPGGANFPPGIIPPPDGGGYGYPPGTIPQGGNPYGTTPPGCFLQRNTQSGCIPGITQDGGDPGMFPGGGFGSGSPPPAVLQGCGPGIIPYCGGPGSRRISGGSGSIHTMARSSIPTTIILSSLLVLSLHMTLSP